MDKIIKKITKTRTKKTKKVSLKDVLFMIEKWAKDNEVTFVGSFMSFDMDKIGEEDMIEENELIGFGQKEEIKIQIETLSEMLNEEKDDLVNW